MYLFRWTLLPSLATTRNVRIDSGLLAPPLEVLYGRGHRVNVRRSIGISSRYRSGIPN
jgi:hypothetical protein